jgi:hypothetical protein
MHSTATVPAPIPANAWSCPKKIKMSESCCVVVVVVFGYALMHVLGRNLGVHMDSKLWTCEAKRIEVWPSSDDPQMTSPNSTSDFEAITGRSDRDC